MSGAETLPVPIRGMGGAVVEVLSWPHYLEKLSPVQQLQVGMMVERYPEFNNEKVVDLLADATTHLGELLDKWFGSMVEEHGVETVHMAAEMLDALGRRSRVKELKSREAERFDLDEMLGVIGLLHDLDRKVEGVEELDRCIDQLGGWEVARLLSPELADALLTGRMEIEEVRLIVDAPNDLSPKESV